jgi:hypothetical protein
MKSKFYQIVSLILLLSVSVIIESVAGTVSKRGTTAAPFLTIGQGARGLAMGSAFVAVADDQSSMYWNPAGIAGLEGNTVMFDHTQWIADIKYNFLGATFNLGSYGAIGLNLTSSNIGDMRVTTTDNPEGDGQVYSVSDVAVGVTYALKLTDKFSIGFNPKIVYQGIWKTSATALAIDLGVKYVTPFDGITLGMSITNFGQKMQLQGTSAIVLYDPDPKTTGNNGNIPANLSTAQWALPLNFRFGIAYLAMNNEIGKLTLAADASHPNDNYESVDLGGEYGYNDFVFIRGGYKSLFLADAEDHMTLGFGIKQALIGNTALTVDYAYQDFGRLKSVQKFSFAITF